MKNFIHNVSLLAGLAALSSGLWHDWDIWLTLQRVVISYLGFFALGLVLALMVRFGSRREDSGQQEADGRRNAGL